MVQLRKRIAPATGLVGGRLSRRGLRPVRVGTTGAARSSLVIVLALSALAACAAPAANHITVMREVFLERGQPVWPEALARTAKGDYVIAGRYEGRGWAIQVTPAGLLQWSYVGSTPPAKFGEHSKTTTLTGVVALSDDSTLLCGHRRSPDNTVAAVITRLGPHGQVLSAQTLYPNGDHRYVLNYFYRCVRWGSGAAVFGTATRYRQAGGVHAVEGYYWLLKLNAHGNMIWEKLFHIPSVEIPGPIPSPPARPLALTDGDLVLSFGDHIILIGSHGTIKAQRIVADGTIVPSTNRQRAVHLLVTNARLVRTWHILGRHLQDIRVESLPGRAKLIWFKKIYRLPSGALALFGYSQIFRAPTLSVGWVSPSWHRRAILRLPGSAGITDAVPTGSPGEFAAVRPVWPLMHPYEKYDPNQAGIVLDFVHIH